MRRSEHKQPLSIATDGSEGLEHDDNDTPDDIIDRPEPYDSRRVWQPTGLRSGGASSPEGADSELGQPRLQLFSKSEFPVDRAGST
jgi:hypothetical protein